jgi:hypothetical protein
MIQNEFTLSLFVIILMALALVCAQQARAQESRPQTSQQLAASVVSDESGGLRYTPPGCEFEITFPGAPFTTRRCHPTIKDQCELMTGFSKTYETFSTMNFYVKCQTNEENALNKYTMDAITTTLIARAGTRLETTNLYHDETEKSRMAALLGAGPTAKDNESLLYIGQMWAGKSSVMTVEAEIIGLEHEPADQQFADILKTIQHIDDGDAKRAAAKQPKKDAKEAMKKDTVKKETPDTKE